MKVLGFVGSPRKNGNTSRLVNAVLAGAAAKGASTLCWHTSDLRIDGCTSCFYCRTNPECSRKDDMAPIYREIFACDAIVIGSPIYMWQMTGQTKIFVDRLYPTISTDFTSRLTRKPKLVLAFTQGQPNVNAFKPYFDSTAKVLGFLGFTVAAMIVAGGTRNVDDVDRQADVMAKAKAIGMDLVA